MRHEAVDGRKILKKPELKEIRRKEVHQMLKEDFIMDPVGQPDC